MQILVINCGSSSIKADIIDTLTKKSIFELDAERINISPEITINKNLVEYNGEINFKNILQFCFQKIKNDELSTSIVGIGHRVVLVVTLLPTAMRNVSWLPRPPWTGRAITMPGARSSVGIQQWQPGAAAESASSVLMAQW